MASFPYRKELLLILGTSGFLFILYFLFGKPQSTPLPPPDLGLDKKGLSFYHKREVNNTIRKHMHKIQACYNQYLETKPSLEEGKIQMDWQIAPDGEVDKVGKVVSEFSSQTLERCLEKEISSWEFPPPPEQNRNTYAEFTFHFRKEENRPNPEDLAPKIINTPKQK